MAETTYINLKVKIQKNSEADITGEIPAEGMEAYKKEVLAEARRDITLPGFRKGQAPEEMIRQHIGEMHLLEDAADRAIRELIPEIFENEKLRTLGVPHVTITKLAPGNPLGFQIKVGILSEIKLPNYRKIGEAAVAARPAVFVSDEEVNGTIEQLRKFRGARTQEGDGKKEEKESLPELTDEFVKSLGNFKDVADFKEKIAENLRLEKELEMKRKTREEIAEKLIKETKCAIPDTFIEDEARAVRESREEEVKGIGISMEEYLKNVGKTEEQILKDERAYVERQIKTKLIFGKIAEEEKIKLSRNEVEQEVNFLSRRHPDASPERLTRYVESMLLNEKVLELLEGKE